MINPQTKTKSKTKTKATRFEPVPTSERLASHYATQLETYIEEKGGQFLRDEGGSLHVVIEGRRIPLNYESNNRPMIGLMIEVCNVSTLLNHEDEKRSLEEAATTMPMFIEDFRFDRINPPVPYPFTNEPVIRLTGRGFRPKAEILVNGVRVSWSKQISTSTYIINKPDQDKFEVTISQPTKQSYETLALNFDPEPARQPVIVSYSGLPKYRARVRLALVFPGQTHISARLGQFEGKIIDPTTQQPVASSTLSADLDKKFRFEVEVDAEQIASRKGRSYPVLRDMISLSLSSPGGQNKSFDILLPIPPSITEIKAASGHHAFEQDVVIRGTNLQHVAKVYFGTRQADMLVQPERNLITVRVPKGAEVPNGEKVRVPVRLETKVDVNGRKISNAGDLASLRAYYVYLGDPLPKPNGRKTKQSGEKQPTGQGSISKSEQ